MSFRYEKKNTYQIPGADLKNHLLSFPKIRIHVCLNFWKVKHETKNKDDPLGKN